MLVKVEELTADLSRVRLFHTSVSRAIASWPTWPGEPGFTGDFAEFLAQTFPTSTAADFAVLEAGIVSEETYVEQGLYWATGHVPMLEYVVETYKPGPAARRHADDGRVPAPVPRARHAEAPERRAEPGLRRRRPQRRPGRPRAPRARRSSGPPTKRPTRSLTLRPPPDRQGPDDVRRLRPRLRAAVPGDRREQAARRPRAAVDAADVATAARRPARPSARPRPAGPAARVQIYLNLAGRDPAGGGFTQVAAADVAATVAAIKAAYLGLTDPNDWTTTASPRAGRSSTASSRRPRPATSRTGRAARPTWPTRPGRATSSCSPIRRTSSTRRRRARSSRRRTSSASTATCPDVQDLAANINMRATFLAGGKGIAKGQVDGSDDRPRADARVPARHPRAAAQPGPRPARRRQGRQRRTQPISIVGLNDFHGQLDPTTIAVRRARTRPVGGAAFLATMFDEELAALPGPGLILAGGDNVGASPPNSGLLQDMPAIDVENAWGLDATSYGNHEFDFGRRRGCSRTRRGRTSRSWRRTSSRTRPARRRRGSRPRWSSP